MKHFLLGVAATLVVLVVGALAYLLLGFAEVRGDQPVTGLERTVMRAAVHASVRRHAPNDSDPVPPTDANLIAGGPRVSQSMRWLSRHTGEGGPLSQRVEP